MGSLLSLFKSFCDCNFKTDKADTRCFTSCCFSHKTVILSPQPSTPRIRSAPQLYRRLTLANCSPEARNY